MSYSLIKRSFDILLSLVAIIIFSPLILPLLFAIYLQDRHNPIYSAPRVGKDGRLFRMYKIRSMIIGADKNKVDSTAENDPRLTPLGRWVRRLKLDELLQFVNVLLGDMSVVGPRPNVQRETRLYSVQEQRLLSIKPGITDLSSIVFSDLGEILADSPDPNIAYNQLVRPWKSRLGLIYVKHQSLKLDLQIIYYTILAVISRRAALAQIVACLKKLNAPAKMIQVAERKAPLFPYPPPGMSEVVTERSS